MPVEVVVARPRCCRRIQCLPLCRRFVPDKDSRYALESIRLTLDEFEAIRLSDYADDKQEDAALEMGVSRQTFGRILRSARKKLAESLVLGAPLEISGGVVDEDAEHKKLCRHCRCLFEPGSDRSDRCPRCGRREVNHEGEGP